MAREAAPRRKGASSNGTSARRCCSGWTNPQQWLMLAMFLLAMFIFGIRFQQSKKVRCLQQPNVFGSAQVLVNKDYTAPYVAIHT